MQDSRYDKISDLFVQYSNGNFDYQIPISDKLDEIDAFISGINMLGEELKEITISKEFFNNVFNSVSDLIFVLDKSGNITMVNRAVYEKVGFIEDELVGVSIDFLFSNGKNSFFNNALKRIAKKDKRSTFSSTFYYEKRMYPALYTFNPLYSENDSHIGYTLIVKDLTNLKKAEEMVASSEEKYRKLFEESGDAIMIIDKNGNILEANPAVINLVGKLNPKLNKNNILNFLIDEYEKLEIKKFLDKNDRNSSIKVRIKNSNSGAIRICYITISSLSLQNEFQVLIRDTTYESEIENLIIRTIVDTQENERKRFAKDIHDSLGQQLSAIKFYLATLNSSKKLDERNQKLIEKSEEGMNEILANLREICFNLMPKTLENFGLVAAVNEICKNIQLVGKLEFNIATENDFPRISLDKEIAIFRIIQEFINNTMKHANATKIEIVFRYNSNEIFITLKDNGIGFNIELNSEKGMGLKNVTSRARSYNGQLKISSTIGSSTMFEIKIPINNQSIK